MMSMKKIIKSDRQFGVEIEFIAPNGRAYDRIQQRLRDKIVFDGSLRPYDYGGEYVSPVLRGGGGEKEIVQACTILKVNDVDIENPKTSMHVHIDGLKDEGDVTVQKKRDTEADYQIAVSNKAMNFLEPETIIRMVQNRNPLFHPELLVTTLDNVRYISRGRLTKHPKMGYTYYVLHQEDRFKWLRNMFYFYTQYDKVLTAMVSKSRGFGNMYCIPLSDSFELDEITDCKTINDIIRVWYKGNGIGGHYDNSRYHNVNLHSYFDRHGTVEIRNHGGTIDHHKVLMWVRLHQYIADKLENMSLEDITIEEPYGDNGFMEFMKFISDDPLLVEYVKRMLGYFSGITILKDKVIRKNK